ncbi:MAG: PAS domain S-box protein [Sulfuricellaceae bacterium]
MSGKSFLRHSLRRQFTFAVLVIFVAGIWVLSYYASWILREDIERLLFDQQFSTVSYVSNEIDRGLKDRIRAMESIAGLIEPSLLDNPPALQAMLERQPILRDIFNAGVFALARDGTCIADVSEAGGRIGSNYSDYDAIHSVLVEGKSAVGRPMKGKKRPRPLFNIAVPIRDAQGKTIGALAGATDPGNGSFLDIVGKQRYGKSGGYLVIAPQYRMFVTASDKSRIMQPLPPPEINQYMQGYEGSGIVVNSRSVEELISAKRIPASGWVVVATLPTEEAFAPVRNMQLRIMLASIFLTLAVGVFSWRLLKHRLSPLLTVVEKMAAMSDASQPLHPLPVTKYDEIGQLVGGFNRLLEIIGEREAQIIAERDFFSALLRQSSDGVCLFDPDGLDILEANPSLCKMLGYERDEILALKLTDLTEESPDDVRAGVQELVQSRLPYIAERNQLRKDGAPVATEVHASLVMVRGKQLIMANIRDITERVKMVEKLLRLNRLFAVLSKTSEAIVRIRVEAALFGRLCHIAVKQGGFRMAWFGWISQESGMVQPVVHAGHEDGFLTHIRDGKGAPTSGANAVAVTDGRVLACNDIRSDPSAAPWRDQALANGYLSLASVPIKRGREVVGLFFVYAAAPGFFDIEVVQLLTEIGQNVSFALDNMALERNRLEVQQRLSELNDQLERRVAERTSQVEATNQELIASRHELRQLSGFLQSVRENERTRIARELHDELGQMLTALKIDICWLEGKLAGSGENICAKLAAMGIMLDQTVDSVRRISSDLRPWILDDLGLGAAIEWLVERFEQQSGIICETYGIDDDEWALDEHIATAIFRIVQEALTNITRHADASHVMVEIRRRGDAILVQVRDNGQGFDLDASLEKKRFGLLGIRERVDMLGGRLDIISSPGAGTSLRVRLPCKSGIMEEQ